jgi:hypothetical protein
MLKQIRYRFILIGMVLFIIFCAISLSIFYYTVKHYHLRFTFNPASPELTLVFDVLSFLPFVFPLYFTYLAIKPIVGRARKIFAYFILLVIQFVIMMFPYGYASLLVVCNSGYDCI